MAEIISKRTAYSKTFDLGGGQRQLTASLGRLHYQDSQGDFQDIDSNITTSDKTGYDYMNTANDFKAHFKSNLDSTQPILFEYGDRWVAFTPKAVALYDRDLNDYTVLATPSDTTADTTNHRITFQGLYPGCTAGFLITDVGMKEFFYINNLNLPDPTTYGYNPDTTYLVLVNQIDHNFDGTNDSIEDESGALTEGRDIGVVEFKKDGTTEFYLPTLMGFDSSRDKHYSLKKRIKVVGGKPYLLHGASYNQAIGATLPLIIDSTLNKNIPTDNDDGYEADESTWWPNAGWLTLGFDDYYYEDGDLGLRFTGVTVAQGSTINSAYLTGYIDETYGSTFTARVYGIDEDNPAQFSSGSRPSQRTPTSAYAGWTVPASTGSKQLPEMKTVVKEIVDRPGFAESAMAFKVQNWNASSGAYRYFSDYPTNVFSLYIDYTEPAAGGLTILNFERANRGIARGIHRGV